jgi:hypothetical protein
MLFGTCEQATHIDPNYYHIQTNLAYAWENFRFSDYPEAEMWCKAIAIKEYDKTLQMQATLAVTNPCLDQDGKYASTLFSLGRVYVQLARANNGHSAAPIRNRLFAENAIYYFKWAISLYDSYWNVLNSPEGQRRFRDWSDRQYKVTNMLHAAKEHCASLEHQLKEMDRPTSAASAAAASAGTSHQSGGGGGGGSGRHRHRSQSRDRGRDRSRDRAPQHERRRPRSRSRSTSSRQRRSRRHNSKSHSRSPSRSPSHSPSQKGPPVAHRQKIKISLKKSASTSSTSSSAQAPAAAAAPTTKVEKVEKEKDSKEDAKSKADAKAAADAKERHAKNENKINEAVAEFKSGDAANLDKVLRICDEIISIDSKHVRSLFLRGLVNRRKNQLEDAKIDFGKVLAIEPNHLDCLFQSGVMSFDCKNMAEADDSFSKALIVAQKSPQHADRLEGILANRANVYATLFDDKRNGGGSSDHVAALEMCEKAIADFTSAKDLATTAEADKTEYAEQIAALSKTLAEVKEAKSNDLFVQIMSD